MSKEPDARTTRMRNPAAVAVLHLKVRVGVSPLETLHQVSLIWQQHLLARWTTEDLLLPFPKNQQPLVLPYLLHLHPVNLL
jgi:hypothetical protein